MSRPPEGALPVHDVGEAPPAKNIEIQSGPFKGIFAFRAGGATLQLCGTLSLEDPMTLLRPFISRIHQEAAAAHVREVEVDIRQLDFMNSGSFKSLIYWIGLIQELPTAAQFSLRFLTSRAKRWQSTSLHALKCFGLELVHVAESP